MKFCSKCLNPVTAKDEKALEAIVSEYLKDDTPWFLGYSGGKDSSSLLKLTWNAMLKIKCFHKPITIIYCDTGVENPIISRYVFETIEKLRAENDKYKLPFKFEIGRPKLQDRFFVKVIGRGYPPPTNIFRWCTDRLRINPVNTIIDKAEKSTILLGIRNGESIERDRTISRHTIDNGYYLNQKGNSSRMIFSPVIHHNIKDVWATLKFNRLPLAIDHDVIGKLYKDAGSECPVYKEQKGTPCGKGRFGCWTCTVVRQDKSVASMVENGYSELTDLYEFRNWLATFRDNPKYRSHQRRNGQKGLEPITLEGRRIILATLLEVQEKSGMELIQSIEIDAIKELWLKDCEDSKYVEVSQ